MNCKRNLFVGAILASVLVTPMVAGAQQATPVAPRVTTPALPPSATSGVRVVREGVVAVVNDDLISTYDLRQEVLWLSITNGVPLTDQTLPDLQQQAIENLIDQRLQAQELRHQAELRKLKPDELFSTDADVEEYLGQLAGQNKLTTAQFMQELNSRGVSSDALRKRIKIDMSWEDFTRNFYGRRVRITPDQIKAVQNKITLAASQPSYLISEIFFDSTRTGGVPNAVNIANQRLAQIQQGARFEALARQFSARPTAANGGEVGWVSAAEVPPAVATALEGMRAGQVSRPIPVTDGVYLIFLREKTAGGATPVVSLKQAAVTLAVDATPEATAAAQQSLLALKAKATCPTLETAAAGMTGVEVGDLGEAELKDLSPAFRTAIEPLAVGQISDPVRTDIGLHLVAVCGRRSSDASVPTAEQIRNKLTGDQLEMLQKRELRNLRAAATISQPR